ncbi:MAG: Maf family protein [Steroidobacteraceae bacterium]
MFPEFVYLASGSARRSELLRQIGVSFRIIDAAVDEAALEDEAPSAYVRRVAAAKANAGWQCSRDRNDAPVLAADTAVVLDGRILGKPRDRSDALDMLLKFSGRSHDVLTAVALRVGADLDMRVSRSAVTFRSIDAAEAAAYWDTGEPAGKAGAYAIQGRAAIFIADLRGSYSGVMGLPLFETAELLRSADERRRGARRP